MEEKIFYVLFEGYVRLRQFLGLALWLGQARGAGSMATSSNEHKNMSNKTKLVYKKFFPFVAYFIV